LFCVQQKKETQKETGMEQLEGKWSQNWDFWEKYPFNI